MSVVAGGRERDERTGLVDDETDNYGLLPCHKIGGSDLKGKTISEAERFEGGLGRGEGR